jgi:hypothetical protein
MAFVTCVYFIPYLELFSKVFNSCIEMSEWDDSVAFSESCNHQLLIPEHSLTPKGSLTLSPAPSPHEFTSCLWILLFWTLSIKGVTGCGALCVLKVLPPCGAE